MTRFRFAFFVAFAFFVHSVSQTSGFGLLEVGGWQQTATIKSETSVLNGTLQEVAFINITVYLYNYTQDSYHLVSDTIRQTLANINEERVEPLDTPSEYVGVNGQRLPLAFNMTLVRIVSVGPKPALEAAIQCHLDVYAKKKHRAAVLDSLEHFSL